eukprot:1089859-Pelagomonas_calceolata.AAC.4
MESGCGCQGELCVVSKSRIKCWIFSTLPVPVWQKQRKQGTVVEGSGCNFQLASISKWRPMAHMHTYTRMSARTHTHTHMRTHTCCAAVVGGREEGYQVALGKALKAVHHTLMRTHYHLQVVILQRNEGGARKKEKYDLTSPLHELESQAQTRTEQRCGLQAIHACELAH